MSAAAQAQLQASLAERYAIEREIGRGGMATVYLARDVKHERRVAVKVLDPELGAVLGAERFLSEIRVTANLQHPNLLPLFDSGEAAGLLYYVMPFVEGETLRARLDRERQLPVDEAVRLAVAVANALDYAHAHGVVHRDLKPENVLLQAGQPVVADFGIALALRNAGGQRVTQTGLSLGTPQYMSPEQATGDRAIDGRTDVYSLGAIAYEMLAGEPPHTGTNAQAVIAKLMTEQPRSITVLRRSVPPHVEAAVQCALEKLPADRFATAKGFAEALQHGSSRLSTGPGQTVAGVNREPRPLARYAPWAVAAIALAGAAGAIVTRPGTEPPRSARFTVTLPTGVTFDPTLGTIAVSPDGSRVAYLGVSDQPRLYVRALDEEESRAVPGTEGANFPFWSPDGAWLGFMAVDGKIKKVPAAGGTPTVIAMTGRLIGPTWGPDGTIVFGGGLGSGLWQVPSTGGTPQPFTAIDSAHGEIWQALPMWSPDGTVLFYTSFRQQGGTRLAVATPDGAGALARTTVLEQSGSSPRFARPSSLMFANTDGVIFRAPYDARRGALTGRPEVVLQDVFVRPPDHAMLGEGGGTLAYVSGRPQSRLALIDARGTLQPLPGEAGQFRHPRVSPDGAHVAVEVAAEGGKGDVWIHEVRTGALTRRTFDGRSTNPVWSPDGTRLAFARRGDDASGIDVYSAPADGSGTAELLVGGPGRQYPSAWSPDSRTLLFDETPVAGGPPRIAAVTLGSACAGRASCERRTVVSAPGNYHSLVVFSPDGRWIAYVSAESGRPEVYVRALAGGGKWQVSVEGGTEPVWSRDGRTLFYRELQRIMAATVLTAPTFAVTARTTRVDDRFARFVRDNATNYDAHPDGRLMLLTPAGSGSRITVLSNWPEALRPRAPSGAR